MTDDEFFATTRERAPLGQRSPVAASLAWVGRPDRADVPETYGEYLLRVREQGERDRARFTGA